MAKINLGRVVPVIRDSLISESKTEALSANQGRVLNDKITQVNTDLTNIGNTIYSANTVTTVSGTESTITTATIPAGTWLLIADVTFSASINAGYREIRFSDRTFRIRQAYVPSGYNGMQFYRVFEFTKATDISVLAMQNSGSSISTVAYLSGTRIK